MNSDIIIVGGGPAGVISALTAKRVYSDKSILLIKEIGDGVIPCAIPYMLHTLDDPEKNRLGNAPLDSAGVQVLVDKAVDLNTETKTLFLETGKQLSFEKLILATGSRPVTPPIPGVEKPGVFGIEKSISYNTVIREAARKAKNVVIIGGGFIGAEFADEIAKGSDAAVHIVEVLPRLLTTAFDEEFCEAAENQLKDLGVFIHTQEKVVSINGKDKVESVTLENGGDLAADMVIIGIGGKPNSELAQKAGLLTTDKGSVWVDAYMRTKARDVFAIGDCALKRDFFTRKEVPIWLASTATAEARIAGTNLYGVRVLRQIQGTIAAFSTHLGTLSLASAGMISKTCDQEGFNVVVGRAQAPDRHPGALPGAVPLTVKLIFADKSGELLGGQVSGGPSAGELINVIAVGIQMRMTVRDLDMMQIATHPLLTPAPTVHPLINAAHQALASSRESTS